MILKNCFLLLLMAWLPVTLSAQQKYSGGVFDAKTKEPIPFATIKFGETGQGMVAGLDGSFGIPEVFSDVAFIEVSYLGYLHKRMISPFSNLNVFLQPDENYLQAVEVKPPYEKMRRIINNAITNKSRNNPDKYDWYRCHVYYKMLVDATLPDSVLNDTAKDSREIKAFLEKQHLLMSESYSIRTWQAPQHLQEDVLASRFSGLKKSVFTSLVTSVVPFHAYDDYIKMNGKDYHNPVSRGFEQYYKFNLSDEIIQGSDTVWVLSFRPKGLRSNDMTGTVYINSSGYAISQIIARANDTMLKLNVRIEQQYAQFAISDSESRWFPEHLNYIIDWQQKVEKSFITYHIKGNSRIDSVDFNRDTDFRFDKAHTVRLQTKADMLGDSAWQLFRPAPLDLKELETYHFDDSIGNKYHADVILRYFSKLPEGKVPLGPVDVDIKRILGANKYENIRLGLGLQTNEQILKWGSVGGWAGYGIQDGQWKYGVFGELYGDPYKESVFRLGYSDDLAEPGRVHLNRDLDKNYLKMYLLRRVDNIRELAASGKKRFGYWNLELSLNVQAVTPEYNYVYAYDGRSFSSYKAREASLGLRYAYAERTVPFFNNYTRAGSKYPIWYGKITAGDIDGNNGMHIPYVQALTAVQWHKHINRLGFEHILIEGGKTWSDGPLPLGKLFAGNGFKYDNKSNTGLYSFGGLMDMYPYEYYTDQFINLIFRHDFDWKLYKLEDQKLVFSSAPNICLQYNMLYGTLSHPEAQFFVPFSIPDNAYHEAGILLNNLLRMRLFNLYYLTESMGYFYHLSSGPGSNSDGRFVFGVGIEF